MGALGVGTVDIKGKADFLYFQPRHVKGYRGETVEELISSPRFGLKPGKDVEVELEGNQVRSVAAVGSKG